MNLHKTIPKIIKNSDMKNHRYSLSVVEEPTGDYLIRLLNDQSPGSSLDLPEKDPSQDAMIVRQFRTKNREFCFNTIEMLIQSPDPEKSAEALVRPWNVDENGVVILNGEPPGDSNRD